MNLVTVIESIINNIHQRVVKVYCYGRNDVRTANEVSPYGIDSCPVKDMVAVYSNTSDSSETVIIGYLNKNQVALPGELRIFATNSAGAEQGYVYLKNDGTIEIAGNANKVVKYTALNTGLQQQVNKINTELAKISAAITALGGAYAITPVTLDITASESNKVKIP